MKKEIIINEIKITSPEKIIFKKINVTKLDVINYYNDISNYLLRHIKNRPISVIRCHNGADETCFFKKHPTNESLTHKIKINDEEYFYLNTKKEIVYEAQMGTIEFHFWGCTIPNINRPNLMVFDLDPDENLPIKKLREGVMLLKQVLDNLKLKSYLKTSGGKGYHILVPIKNMNWKNFSNFSKQIAIFLEEEYPNLFTTNIKKINRKNKIFIDFLRNKKGATCVAPYSLRSRDNAPISMPIEWSMLDKVKPNEVTIKNYKKYLN